MVALSSREHGCSPIRQADSLVAAIDAHDPYAAGHSGRVRVYASTIGVRLGLRGDDLAILELGAYLHDVGKLGISAGVLTNACALTAEEYELVKQHAVLGAEMLARHPDFAPCVPLLRWHHERLDGSGYPDGLTAGSISLLPRILAVADVFDAMTSDRAYRRAIPLPQVLVHLEKEVQQGRLDGRIVALFADTISGVAATHRAVADAAA